MVFFFILCNEYGQSAQGEESSFIVWAIQFSLTGQNQNQLSTCMSNKVLLEHTVEQQLISGPKNLWPARMY